jgi:hypothetical protein
MSGYFSPRWQPAELKYLQSIIYSSSVAELIPKLQTWQKNKGLHIRSGDAIRRKCLLLGRDKDYQEDRLSISQLAKMLDIHRARINLWLLRGLPHTQKYRNREVSITVKDFQAWAELNPGYLHSIDRTNLNYFLSEDSIDRIPKRSPFKRRVRCVETGQIFDSMQAAAAAIGAHKVNVYRAIEHNGKCKGYRWEQV